MVSIVIFVEVISLVKNDVCPFDGLPCDHVDDCDDVLELRFGIDCSEDGLHCSRAVFPLK